MRGGRSHARREITCAAEDRVRGGDLTRCGAARPRQPTAKELPQLQDAVALGFLIVK